MGYFWRYLIAETNWLKITLIFNCSRRKQRTFGGLVWPVKISPTFGGNYFQRLLSAIFGGFLWRLPKFKSRQKNIRSYFRRFFLAVENSIDLFSVGFF
jgi:hypothetical protein